MALQTGEKRFDRGGVFPIEQRPVGQLRPPEDLFPRLVGEHARPCDFAFGVVDDADVFDLVPLPFANAGELNALGDEDSGARFLEETRICLGGQ